MKAIKIIIECSIDFKCEYIQYENQTVEKAMKSFFKKYKEAIIYNIKTEY